MESIKAAKSRQSVVVLHGVDGTAFAMVVGGPGKMVNGERMGEAIPY